MMNPTDAGPVSNPPKRIPVSISAPHVYLAQAAIETLFCDKYRLHESARTHQPNQYAAQESVTLIGPRGRLPDVRVIGPPRSVNQVEISRSDARTLGIDVPVRESGDLDGTPGVIIEGPRACVQLDRGVIRAQRHLHMTPEDANRLGLRDRDRVAVASADAPRRVLFHEVLVHISAECRLELHLNCDDGDATALHSGDYVVLCKHPHTQQGTHAEPRPLGQSRLGSWAHSLCALCKIPAAALHDLTARDPNCESYVVTEAGSDHPLISSVSRSSYGAVALMRPA